jgi:hypothetical protein
MPENNILYEERKQIQKLRGKENFRIEVKNHYHRTGHDFLPTSSLEFHRYFHDRLQVSEGMLSSLDGFDSSRRKKRDSKRCTRRQLLPFLRS